MQYVLFLPFLVFAAWSDIKCRTIPLWLFPSAIACFVFYCLVSGIPFTVWNPAGLFCAFIPAFILGMTGMLGGADIIMFSALGFLLGKNLIIYVISLAVISTLFFIVTGFKNRTYPIAPFALTAFIVFLIWR